MSTEFFNVEAARTSDEELAGRLLRYNPQLLRQLHTLLRTVGAYLPHHLTHTLLQSTSDLLISPLEGTVMYADIDGFTAMAEHFSRTASQQGAEELTALVNRFLEILISTSGRYGGDLQKFGGDSGLILYTGEEQTERAIAAALEVQRRVADQMEEVETSLGTFALHIAIGLSAGQMIGVGLGDERRREWWLSGPALVRAGKAQMGAPANRVALHVATLDLAGLPLRGTLQDELYLVEELEQRPAPLELPPLPLPPQDDEYERLTWLLSRLDGLSPYVSAALLDRLTTVSTPAQFHLWSEHRNVTVLMLGFTGFPELTELGSEPSEMRRAAELPNRLFNRAHEIIEQYDGVVNKIGWAPQGAYLMALFGAPVAHEDDPLRAVLAALDLREEWESPLSMGINTGFVFAGDVGTDERREYTVMGDEVNLAYRLMARSEPGELWLGPNTAQHSAVVRRIEGVREKPQRLKGKETAVVPFSVHGVRRIHAGVETEVLPLVGRQEELAAAVGALEKTLAGEPQSVLIQGGAGTGKSRVIHALAEEAEARGMVSHIGVAPSYGVHLPYTVWERPLRQLLELDALPLEAQPEHFHQLLATQGLAEWSALLAPLVNLDLPPSPQVATLPPNLREQQRQMALHALLEGRARMRPRLLVFENAHWIPSPSLSLIRGLLKSPHAAPYMIVITARGEGEMYTEWQEDVDVNLTLGPLSRSETRSLARRVANTDRLPREVERWLIRQGGGNPLFTIEAVQLLIASGVLVCKAGVWELTQALIDAPLPETTYGVIQSRIDQLEPPSRHLLRSATVVGEQMTVEMLISGYGQEPPAVVARRLPVLTPLGLVYGDRAHETLVFRQPLVREVAYRGLPYRIRKEIHGRLATYLNYQREEATSNWLALLAHHAYEGQIWETALQINLELGQRALANYLIEQAVQAFERVLRAAERGQLPAQEERREALHLLSEALTLLGEYDAALARLEETQALLPPSPTQPADLLFLAHLEYHRAEILKIRGEYEKAIEVVKRGLALPLTEESLEGARLFLVGAGLYHAQGEIEKADVWAQKSATLAREFPSTEARKVEAYSLFLLASLAYLQGEIEQSGQLSERSLEMYVELGDLVGEMNARNQILILHLLTGSWERAVEQGERALALARRVHHTEGEAKVSANLGEVYRYQGRQQKARRAYTRTLEIAQERGITFGVALMHQNLAVLDLEAGALDEAEKRLEVAERIFNDMGAAPALPEVHRHRSALELAQGHTEEALEWATRSLRAARAQRAQQEVGRTQRTRAQVLLDLHRYEEALAALEEALQIAEENQDSYGLAQALLTRARVGHATSPGEPGAIADLNRAVVRFEALGAQADLRKARSYLTLWTEKSSEP